MSRRIVGVAFLLTLISTSAFAQWTWLNPTPQGNALYDIAFLDDQCAIAVGDAGTVLVTHDAGVTWTVRTKVNGLSYRLLRIDRIDDNTAIVVGTNSVIMRTTDQGANWSLVLSSTTGDILDLSFADGVHGVAVVGTKMIRSTDGGLTWLPPVNLGVGMRAVDMISSTEAIAVGESGAIFRTSDSGATWVVDWSLIGGAPFSAVDFLDADHGVVGSYHESFVTSDAGATWSPFYFAQHTDADWTPNEILYVESNLILAALTVQYHNVLTGFSGYGGSFMSSMDGGFVWEQETTPRIVGGLARNADEVVLVVGDHGSILRSVGNEPLLQIGGATDDYQLGQGRSSFVDTQVGMIASSTSSQFQTGYSTFSRTTDAGQSWQTSYVSNFQMNDLAHVSGSVVYAVGTRSGATRGSIRRSLDGGATWSEIGFTTSPVTFTAIGLSSTSVGVAVGNSGGAVVIDGATVSPVTTGTSSHLQDVAFATPSIVVAIGLGGVVIRSTDTAQTWAQVPLDGTQTALLSVGFASDTVGFIAGLDGNLRRTDDGGLTWQTWAHYPGSAFYAIDFFDSGHGMAVGKDGLVLASDDGGDTWENVTSPTIRTLNVVTMVGDHSAYISGFDRLLLGYDTEQPTPIRDTPSSELSLLPNFPNPFNPSTTIRYVIPSRERVRVEIYDVSGRLVTTLVDREEAAGSYGVAWNGTSARGERVASGVYMVRIEAGKQSRSRKIVLLK